MKRTEEVSVLDQDISILGLRTRAKKRVELLIYNIRRNSGREWQGPILLRDVAELHEDQLMLMRNFGVVSLHEVKSKLEQLGLNLKPGNFYSF